VLVWDFPLQGEVKGESVVKKGKLASLLGDFRRSGLSEAQAPKAGKDKKSEGAIGRRKD